MVVGGNAGLGKTRLAVEVQRREQKAGALVLSGTCSHVDLSLPYLPFLEAIGNYFSLTDLNQVPEITGRAARELAHLFPQIGLEPARHQGDPSQAKLRLFEAIFALFQALSRRQPLLLVIEDIHWADSSTLELLDYLSRRLRVLSTMLVTTYRTEELNLEHRLHAVLEGWRRTGKVTFLDLEPLTRSDVAEMVRAIFELEAVRDDLRDLLHQRSEGNPFILEEILKAALDQGDIFQGDAGWSRRNLAGLSLPATVKDMILLRMERLPAGSSEVLRMAALIGETFDFRTLVQVTRRRERVIDAVLRAALRHQLLEDDLTTPGRYRFRHALTREAILQDVAGLERRRLHARVAAVLERIPGTPRVQLATHLLAAGEVERAIPVCLAAAAEAEERRGYREAADLYARVLPRLIDNVEHARTLCRLGRALVLAGDTGGGLHPLVEGIRLLEACGRAVEAAGYRLLLGGCYWERSRVDLARIEYEQARATLEAEGPSDKLADAYVRLSHLSQGAYRWSDGVRMAQRAIAIAEAAHSDGARIAAYTFLGHCLADLGQVDEGLRYLQKSYEQARDRQLDWVAVTALAHICHVMLTHFRAKEMSPVLELLRSSPGTLREASLALFFEGRHHYQLGQPKKARQALERGLELAREASARTIARWNQLGLALVVLTMGLPEVAGRLLDAGDVTIEQQELAEFTMWRIRFTLDAGSVDEAVRLAEHAANVVDWKRRIGVDEIGLIDSAAEALVVAGEKAALERLEEKWRSVDVDPGNPFAMRLMGRLRLAAGDGVVARASFVAAAAFFREVGYRPEEWRTRRALAEALLQLGDSRAARRELRAVISESEAAGVMLEAASARRQLGSLGEAHAPTPDNVRVALEQLDDRDALAETPLADLPAIPANGAASGDALRTVLIESMRQLADSGSPREAEAGQLLLDYYVRRAGSHELVAERLHLSRATFYRRLRLGWELLAKRLPAAEYSHVADP